jgi:hypothetical protein
MIEKMIKKLRLETEEGRRKLFKWMVFISLFMLLFGYALILFLLLR